MNLGINNKISDWRNRHSAKRVLSWNPEKGHDGSVSHIAGFLDGLHGAVLEIGPGPGSLLQYLPKGVSYSAVEPNPYLHDTIRAAANKSGRNAINIIQGSVENIPCPDATFDAVVSVRTLCSMDTAQALREIKRVLKPHGQFVFVEHVVAPKGTIHWFVEQLIRYPHRILRGGCDPAKDIERFIRQAGFASVQIERFKVERDFTDHRIAGVAVK
jgi:SAM-dependent methyltransferase